MKSFSGLGIGLSLVFGCLLLALVAELSYLLWWKKRALINNAEIEEDEEYNKYAKEFFHLICWRRSSSSQTNANLESSRNLSSNGDEAEDPELGFRKDIVLKPFGEEGVESELMRLHNLAGPPRFLCTIKEETKEDLESENGKSRKGSRNRSLSDLIMAVETPLFTPLASPPAKASPLNPLDSYKHHGLNPLFELSIENELTRFKSSPPPKLKFLRDAEEKLCRRLREEAQKMKARPGSAMAGGEKDGYFSIVGQKIEQREVQIHSILHSSSSQVLPLVSSPPPLRPVDTKPTSY